MTTLRDTGSTWRPIAIGLATLVGAFAAIEAMIRIGWINAFIVPLPSAVLSSFERIIVEEGVLRRFLFTAAEAFAAGPLVPFVGISLGVLLYRKQILPLACETWVAALAAAPLVLIYPMFLVIFGRNALTIVMIGFLSGLP